MLKAIKYLLLLIASIFILMLITGLASATISFDDDETITRITRVMSGGTQDVAGTSTTSLTLCNPCPCNESENIDLNTTLKIYCSSPNGSMLNLSWYWGNSSENCTNLFSTNYSIYNGTYMQVLENATEYNTSYFWRVNLTDGYIFTEEVYHFTTETLQNELDPQGEKITIKPLIGVLALFCISPLAIIYKRRRSE